MWYTPNITGQLQVWSEKLQYESISPAFVHQSLAVHKLRDEAIG